VEGVVEVVLKLVLRTVELRGEYEATIGTKITPENSP